MIRFSFTRNKSGLQYSPEVTTFPAGEIGVNIAQAFTDHEGTDIDMCIIHAYIHNAQDVLVLLNTVDAVRRMAPDIDLYLDLAYVPYARQDRICNMGESFSLKVFANLINACNFKEVVVFDPHSDVTAALIDRIAIIEPAEIFGSIRKDWSDWHIVAPDAGAMKKATKFAQAVGAASVITCTKERDLKTGQLSSFKCHSSVIAKKLFVLDDICDGGGTFAGLEPLFLGCTTSELAVTHGIFSKGPKLLTNLYDVVYTTTSYYGPKPPAIWSSIPNLIVV